MRLASPPLFTTNGFNHEEHEGHEEGNQKKIFVLFVVNSKITLPLAAAQAE
ncbi:MAG: hypothetical protein ACI8QI_000117 [Limisphaerales bacterium]|jgi:hypothetical protein